MKLLTVKEVDWNLKNLVKVLFSSCLEKNCTKLFYGLLSLLKLFDIFFVILQECFVFV